MKWKRMVYDNDEMGVIKKGPWKAEEDEVLINHVNKYGPRDWSSIRSKGLLQRTGKSCRLRWVNKLRPNLKNGVKFSAEEERIVIDLQAQFGNKWAKIATFMPGRTDNDVKNFWSSRQKRLARILQTSETSSNKLHKISKELPVLHDVRPFEAPKLRLSTKEEPLSKSQSCSSSYTDTKLVPFQEIVSSNSLNFEQNLFPVEFCPGEQQQCREAESELPFSQIPPLQADYLTPLEGQEYISRLGDQDLLDVFGRTNPESDNLQLQSVLPSFGLERSSEFAGCQEGDNPVTSDTFIGDFPVDMDMDMFDRIELLPSPSKW